MVLDSNKPEKEFPKLAGLPVDICIFTVTTERRTDPQDNIDKRTLKSYPKRWVELVLVQRITNPFQDKWALPGGFTDLKSEDLDAAAKRELKEETNLEATIGTDAKESINEIYLEQLKAYYRPDRDPRGWTPTVAFVSLVNEKYLAGLRAGGDAKQAQLLRVHAGELGTLRYQSEDGEIVLDESDLAFDHAKIIRDALEFIQNKMMTTTIAATLLPKEFTITELHQVISAVVPAYAPSTTNFTRDLVKTKSRDGMLEEILNQDRTPKKSTQNSARPAQLYKFSEGFEPRLSIYPRF